MKSLIKVFLAISLIAIFSSFIFTLPKSGADKINRSFYTSNDIITLIGNNRDTVYVYSEVCKDPIFIGTFEECLIIVSEVSYAQVRAEDMYLDYDFITADEYHNKNSKYYNKKLGLWIMDHEWSTEYAWWVARQYESIIDNVWNYSWDETLNDN